MDINKEPLYWRWIFWWKISAFISFCFVVWTIVNWFREPSQDRIFTFLLTVPAAVGFATFSGLQAKMKDIYEKEEWHKL
jgi:hypothetical protein